MIYMSFAVITGNLYSYLILIGCWSVLFTMTIYLKECSNYRKKGAVAYCARTNLFLPRVLGNWYLDTLLWVGLIYSGFYLNKNYDMVLKSLNPLESKLR